MSNAKSKQAKPKTGLARCMELASDRKGLVFLAAVLSSLAAIASFIPYIAVYFMIRSIIGVFPNLDQLDMGLSLIHIYRNRLPISLPPRRNRSRSDEQPQAQAGCAGSVLGIR